MRYYASSGSYGCAESTAAMSYNGMSALPTVVFNGEERMVGGGDFVASGVPYLNIVRGTYFRPSPIRLEVDSFDAASGAISATVTMYSETDSLAGDHIRFILMEDGLETGGKTYNQVTRAIINDTITLSGAGNPISFNKNFTIDPGWIEGNLRVVVFVQRINKEIVQAATDKASPEYDVRGMIPFSKVLLGPASGIFSSGNFTVINTGLDDTYTVNIVVDEAPAGWTFSYTDDLGGEYTTETSLGLTHQTSSAYHVNVMPTSYGSAKFHLVINSPNLTAPMEVPFAYVTEGVDYLIVDDDGGETFEDYFTAALDTVGGSYAIWDRSFNELTPEASVAFPLLIWNVGWSFPSLNPKDQSFLTAHLDAGRSLFVSGQDIGYDLDNDGGASLTFMHEYLHANYVNDDTNILDLFGVDGDPVSDGLSLHIAGGDGANNQTYPSQISAYDGDATEILFYQSLAPKAGAVRSIDSVSGARVVYTAFGFEGIDNAADRAALLGSAVNWLNYLFTDDFETGDLSAWSVAVP